MVVQSLVNLLAEGSHHIHYAFKIVLGNTAPSEIRFMGNTTHSTSGMLSYLGGKVWIEGNGLKDRRGILSSVQLRQNFMTELKLNTVWPQLMHIKGTTSTYHLCNSNGKKNDDLTMISIPIM